MKKLRSPLSKDVVRSLKAGDEVLLSGIIYTARDQAHKRFFDMIKAGKKLPLDLKGALIYYAGPTPARAGRPIGSCGPTTSSRMDAFAPALMSAGICGMIGKGDRSEDVRRSIMKHGCVYLLAPAGLGALLSTKVKSSKVVLFPDLGPEAVYRLEVEDFPAIVAIDSKGHNVYASKRKK